MGYYIAHQGVQQGPFELHDLPNRGLRPDSLVWTESMADWQPAQNVPEVAALFAGPAPGPVSPAGRVPLQPLQSIPYHTPVAPPTNGLAVASMVLGIVAIFPMSCFYGFGIFPSILAIVFGTIARKRVRRGEIPTGDGMALAGVICGIVAVVFSIFWIVFFILAFASALSRHRF